MTATAGNEVGDDIIPGNSERQRYWAVIPAAGVGRRMQSGSSNNTPKQYLKIQGRTILEHTLDRLRQIDCLTGIVLVLGEQDDWWSRLDGVLHEQVQTALGGAQRANSVYNGLQALQGSADDDDWVLVHDVVRPCVSLQEINTLITTLSDDEAGGILATPVRETLKRVSHNLTVECTVPREDYWLAGTPQMFRYGLLKKAMEKAIAGDIEITDEAHAMEKAGHCVKVVHGSAENIKITHPEDIFMAELILNGQAAQ